MVLAGSSKLALMREMASSRSAIRRANSSVRVTCLCSRRFCSSSAPTWNGASFSVSYSPADRITCASSPSGLAVSKASRKRIDGAVFPMAIVYLTDPLPESGVRCYVKSP